MNSLTPSVARALSAGGLKTAPKRRLRGQFAQFMKHIASPFRRKRVLLLEDDTSMHRLVAKLLRPLHVKVEPFGNGRAVVARIASDSGRYDVLLLDLMMPHHGGLTVLRNLRDHHRSLLGKVILLTGSPRGITDPWSPSVFAVVHKPFVGSALVATVRACVQKQTREDTPERHSSM